LKKLAIITSHPIQYNAPVFKLLAERKNIWIKVFYTWGEKVLENKYDPGFKRIVQWDIPLLEGYEYEMVENISKDPGSHHFNGIINSNLINKIETWNPDSILILGWSYQSHLKSIRYFSGKRTLFFWGDSNLLDGSGNFIKNIFRKIFLKWLYSKIDIAFYVGQATKKYYIKYGVKNDRLLFVPHAIENSRFSNAAGIDFRKKLNIPTSNILFLFAGKFENKKNPLLLLEAFTKINSENIELLFVGNGPIEDELKNQVHDLSDIIKRRIHFMDFQNQSQMPDVYKACDVFVLPSKGPGETWGLAINEAMASSKPVLISDKCGAAEDLVQNGINGYTFESNNIQSMISKMELVITQKDQLEIMGKQSYAIIQDWSFEMICMAIENAVYSNNNN